MILYTVHYQGYLTSYEPSIVSIHTTLKGANNKLELYQKRAAENESDCKYFIYEINTDDQYSDMIYDYNDADKRNDYFEDEDE